VTPDAPFTLEEARAVVGEVVLDVAPDLQQADLRPDADLRRDLELDSLDFVNVVAGLSDRLGHDIPERDYDRLHTVEACAAYLTDRAGAR
jgi:acyl carrier protein